MAVILHQNIPSNTLFSVSVEGAEVLGLKIELESGHVALITVYRAPQAIPLFNSSFLELLSSVCSTFKQVIVLGDFNYWYDTPIGALQSWYALIIWLWILDK